MFDYVWAAAILTILLIGIEWLRSGGILTLHFFSMAVAIYGLCFIFAPFIVWTTEPSSGLFVRFPWAQHLNDFSGEYFAAGLVILLGYIAIQCGYQLRLSRVLTVFDREVRDDAPFVSLGLLFFVIGLVAFIFYTEMVGGLATAIREAGPLRDGVPEDAAFSQFAFIKRISLFTLPGAVLLSHALTWRRSLAHRLVGILLFTAALVVGIAVLIAMSGRLVFVAFLLPFVMPWFIQRRSGWIYFILVALVIGLPVILVGKFATNIAFKDAQFGEFIRAQVMRGNDISPQSPTASSDSPAEDAADRNSTSVPIPRQAGSTVSPSAVAEYLTRSIFFEFSFPLATLLSAIHSFPDQINYRYFYDVPLAVLRLIPSRLWDVPLPPPLWKLNTDLLKSAATGSFVPPDLLSFGWISLGPGGVLIVCVFFGLYARLLSDLLRGQCYVARVMYCNWMILVGFFLMYGSPDWVIKEVFHWHVALGAYLVLCTKRISRGVTRPWLNACGTRKRPSAADASSFSIYPRRAEAYEAPYSELHNKRL